MIKKHIVRIVGLTTYISFGTLIACGIWYLVTLIIADTPIMTASMPYITLWEIPILGFVCALGTEVLMVDDHPDMKPREAVIRIIIHYIYVNAAALVCGYIFGWYDLTVSGVLLMLLTSALIYGFTYFFTYINRVNTANKLNQKLNDYKKNK